MTIIRKDGGRGTVHRVKVKDRTMNHRLLSENARKSYYLIRETQTSGKVTDNLENCFRINKPKWVP